MGIDAKMFIRTKQKVTPELVLEKAYLLASAFGHKRFFIDREGWNGKPRHALEIIDRYVQDGPDIDQEQGETFIECHLWTRYYGEEYARGDLPFIISVARWLEHHFPDCVIWYGGDSSGVEAEPFTEAEREKLWLHFCEDRNSYSSYFGREASPLLCSWCKQPMINNTWFGGGTGNLGYNCPGCGEMVYWEASTKTAHRFTEEKKYAEFAETMRTKVQP